MIGRPIGIRFYGFCKGTCRYTGTDVVLVSGMMITILMIYVVADND